MFENYYRILGIPLDADEKALKKAFRQLALKLHPDVNKAADANQRFQELCEAYEVILRHIHNQTTFHTNRVYETAEKDYSYEDVIREAREASYKRAKMKYEKMKAEKEMFEQSGWRDVVLVFNYLGRFLSIPVAFFFIALPIVVAINEGIGLFFALIFFWIIGGFMLHQVYSARKTYFRQGKLRWKFRDFFKLFDFRPITDSPGSDCYYCEGKKADAKPNKLNFHKIRDVKIRNYGVHQHYVGYDRKFKDVIIPRSAKARKVHFVQSLIKIFSLAGSILFVPFPDLIWRICFGLFAGVLLSSALLFCTRTRSKVSYLLNYYLLIKLTIWMIVIISQTTLHPGFILESTEMTFFYLIILLFFGDMVLDLLLRVFPFYSRIYQPVFSQGSLIDKLFKDGYQNFPDVPVWSTIYPLVTWFF
jgi:curved DNA-binding protein CbpA